MMILSVSIILFLMVIGAYAALQIKDLLSSLIVFTAVGLCLSALYLLFQVPYLAIVQLIVETLFFLIIIKVTTREDNTGQLKEIYKYILVFIMMIIVFIIIKSPFLKDILIAYRMESINPASNERILDIIGEMVVLFIGLVGIVTILKRK